MRARLPVSLGVLIVITAFASGQVPRLGSPILPVGSLVTPAEPPQVVPYQPQAGDIIVYDDFNRFYKIVFKFAGTSAPSHVAMVIDRPDGTPALLELTGPRMATAKVCIVDVEPRLAGYPGIVMVRRLRRPLSAEQSHELTRFAQTESGKSFALGRVMLQGTPFSPRNGLRKELFGKTHATRDRWFCSELVVSACALAGIFERTKYQANATYPRDLAFDETMDLSAHYHPPIPWHASPPRQLSAVSYQPSARP